MNCINIYCDNELKEWELDKLEEHPKKYRLCYRCRIRRNKVFMSPILMKCGNCSNIIQYDVNRKWCDDCSKKILKLRQYMSNLEKKKLKGTCWVCENKLTGNQTKFCSVKCRSKRQSNHRKEERSLVAFWRMCGEEPRQC